MSGLSEMLPSDEVTQAYRAGLAWQYERLQELEDRLERWAQVPEQ